MCVWASTNIAAPRRSHSTRKRNLWLKRKQKEEEEKEKEEEEGKRTEVFNWNNVWCSLWLSQSVREI